MNERRLTPANFDNDNSIRHALRYKYDFGHEDLERAKGIISDAIEHVEHKTGTSSGLSGNNLDTAMKFLNKDHEEWKRLPEHKRERITAALKEHFDIVEPE